MANKITQPPAEFYKLPGPARRALLLILFVHDICYLVRELPPRKLTWRDIRWVWTIDMSFYRKPNNVI